MSRIIKSHHHYMNHDYIQNYCDPLNHVYIQNCNDPDYMQLNNYKYINYKNVLLLLLTVLYITFHSPQKT